MKNRAMRGYALRRGWIIAMQVKGVESGEAKRHLRESLLEVTRCRLFGTEVTNDPLASVPSILAVFSTSIF